MTYKLGLRADSPVSHSDAEDESEEALEED